MDFEVYLQELAAGEGADFFGVADLAIARDAILEQGGPPIAGYPLAVSVGIRLADPIVDLLTRKNERAVASSYKHHCYDVINGRLDVLSSKLAGAIQRSGFKAYPLPSSMRVSDEKICAIFFHKMAAHLAGLGWIGKSCLLVTPEAGPRVRWTTVLTNAPLAAGKPMEERCGECRECVDACPVQSFSNKNFRADEPREARYDARRCEKYLNGLEKSTGYRVCGMCLYVCPYGKKALR